jgi:cell division ATPase FtsA
MDLCIVDCGRVYGAHSVKLGGDNLTEAIMHDRKVSVEEAERIKREQGVDLRVRLVMEGTEANASRVEDWLETAAAEMRRAAVAMTVKSPAQWPTKVVLVGASSGVPELASALGQRVGIPIVQADPWAAMGICEICSMTTADPPSAFAAATGLAKAGLDGLPSINLKPCQAAQGRLVERKERALLVGMGVTAVLFLAVLLARAPAAEESSGQLSALKKQTKQMAAQIRLTGPDRRAEAKAVKTVVAGIEKNGYGCLDLLQQASESLPRSVSLSDLSYQAGDSVVLKGRALSNSAVADAVDALVFLGLFDSVNMDYSNLATDAGNQTYDFQITCALPGSKTKMRKAGIKSAGRQGPESRTGIVVR